MLQKIAVILLISTQVLANYRECPSDVLKNEKFREAIEFLRVFPQNMKFWNCKVEVHLCSGSSDNVVDSVVGDVLITTSKGKEFYTQLVFSNNSTWLTKTNLSKNQNVLFYEFKDFVPDSLNGHTEKYWLEVSKNHRGQVKHIEAGNYTSKYGDLNRTERARWAICGEGEKE